MWPASVRAEDEPGPTLLIIVRETPFAELSLAASTPNFELLEVFNFTA
jgi:hypothetical protein